MSEAKILLVEDDPVVRLVTQTQLQYLGYDCTSVGSGEDALKADRQDINLILMDIGLPGMDGIQTTVRLREIEESQSGKHVPIIALTAHSNEDQCLLAGMDDFLQKPVLLGDLKAALEKWWPNSGGS